MAGKGKGALRIAIEDFLNTFKLGEIFNNWFTEWGEKQEEQINSHNSDLMDMIKDIPDMPEAVKKLAEYKPGDKSQGGILSATGFASQVGSSMAGGIMQPIINILNYAMDYVIGSRRMDLPTLLEAERRGFIDPDVRKNVGKEIGWKNVAQEVFIELTNRLIGAGDLITLWRRGEISEGELDRRLIEQAYDEPTIEELKKITEVIPGVGDLINMSVKEAFNPGVVKKFGYDQEFPEEVATWAAKQE